MKGYIYFNSTSGGVGVFIDDSLKNYFDIINCSDHCKDCSVLCNLPNVLWILLGKVIFVIAYFHPEGSIYAEKDILYTVTYTTIELMNLFEIDKLCMMGDFNARTGRLDYFIVIDEQVTKANPFVPDIVNNCLSIPSCDIDVLRVSKDSKVNSYGRSLVQMCQNLDIRITNGRFGVTSLMPTCKDASVADYFLVSPQLFVNILDMNVKSFDPIISDVHNAVELYLDGSSLVFNNDVIIEEEHEEATHNYITTKYTWSDEDTEKKC